MKVCKNCNIEKPLDEFYKLCKSRQHLGDGHQAQCKECVKAFHRTEDSKASARLASKKRYSTPEGKAKEKSKNLKYRQSPRAKELQRLRYIKWIENNPEKHREMYLKHGKKYRKTDGFKKAIQKWRNNNKEKHAAHIIVTNALSSGKLIRPNCCSNCNSICIPEAHHPDYSKPLDVIWLCRQCHVDIHTSE